MPVEQWPKHPIENPQLEYPVEAGKRYLSGNGVFELQIVYANGRVTKIKVVHSNGSNILDNAAIGALKNWRFRPEIFTAVRVAITFSDR